MKKPTFGSDESSAFIQTGTTKQGSPLSFLGKSLIGEAGSDIKYCDIFSTCFPSSF